MECSSKNGITIAGNIVVDVIKCINCYPNNGMLAYIEEISSAVGGCVPNTAINLAKIDNTLPVSAIGKIGTDEHGRYLLSQLNRYNIDIRGISVSSDQPTSFCDVMSVPSGERTFFHAKGANTEFSPEDVDIDSVNSTILHIGYVLLLDCFDKEDSEYGTVMARFLHDVQAHGIKTSVDVVSDCAANYKAKILPVLKYCNYIILNEVESSMLSDLEPYDANGELNQNNIKKTMKFMAQCGVKEKIIVHSKKASFCYDVSGDNFTVAPSVDIPSSEIKGSVGAGDAFCAACLYGIYNDYDDKRILEFAAAAAACNLFSENSIDGMRCKNEIEKISEKYGWKKL